MKLNSLYIIIDLFLLLLPASLLMSQSTIDRTALNSEREKIRSSSIKSKTVWEFHYEPGNEEAFRDSGYKSYFYGYDRDGNLLQYVKYHVFSDMTIRELYQYDRFNHLYNTTRYNSAGEVIETIEYKYNGSGKLKKEIHTAFYNSVRPGVYFSILASMKEDSLFGRLQEDLVIEPKFEAYYITVNISDPDEQNQYIVIGDESDPTSPRFPWSQLSLESQRGLLSYKGPNRKEHTYINKNIAEINYKYDKNGSLISKDVYNTANDLLDKEFYRYNGNNKKIAYYKYGEKGKISSMETYAYNDKGLLSETIGLDPDGKPVSRLTYKYDDYGNLIEKLWYNTEGEINGKYNYAYDNNFNLLEETKFRGENEKEYRLIYKYDANGNLLEILRYDINDKKEKLIRYLYEYY